MKDLESLTIEQLKAGECSVERALLVVSGLESEKEVAAYQRKLDLLQQGFERRDNALGTSSFCTAAALFYYLWRSRSDRYNGDYLLATVIDNQLAGNRAVGNCLGLTSLYSVLGVRLGLDLAVFEGKRYPDEGNPHVLNVLITRNGSRIAVENTTPSGFSVELTEFQRQNYAKKDLIYLVASTCNSRGSTKKNLEDFQGAISDYNKALQIDPNYAIAYNNRGVAKMHLGDFKGAISDYNKALQIDPGSPAIYNNRGIAKENLGDLIGAISDYNKALQIDPKYTTAHNNLSMATQRL
ncbi:MAG: tetratricopeptide repeat protein [Nanoarchaeota archaeon]